MFHAFNSFLTLFFLLYMKTSFVIVSCAFTLCSAFMFGQVSVASQLNNLPRASSTPKPTTPPKPTNPPQPTASPRPTQVPGGERPTPMPTSTPTAQTTSTPRPTIVPTAFVPSATETPIPALTAAPPTPTTVAASITPDVALPTATATFEAELTEVPAETPTALPSSTPDATLNQIQIMLEQTNAYRALSECEPLTVNVALANAAMAHSQDMAQNDFLSHTGSNGSTPADRIVAAGYQWLAVGENIAVGMDNAVDAVNAWYNEVPPSDFHRRNLLNCDFEDVGIGYYYLANDTGTVNFRHYWTMVLGKK